MKWICVLLNFFFPGLGYLVGVPEKRAYAWLWMLGAAGLTYVEQGSGLAEALPTTFHAFFASVFVLNTAFAVDTYLYFRGKERAGSA
jgi:hypothetical protein